MTSGDDVLFLHDEFNNRHADSSGGRIQGIELIEAGAGNDVIDLTSPDYQVGDITIYGGLGNDVLWSSAGDDVLYGESGNDSLFGGGGDDTLDGGAGDDYISGSSGNDLLLGGAGNDILLGGSGRADSEFVEVVINEHYFANGVIFPDLQEHVSILDLVPPGENALGIAAGDLSVEYSTTATVSFVQTESSFHNSLGFYNISQDGTMQMVDLAFSNVTDFSAGDSATITLPGAPP